MTTGPCPGSKSSGTKFTNKLVNQGPVFDGRRRHNKAAPKHRGNKRRDPKYIA